MSLNINVKVGDLVKFGDMTTYMTFVGKVKDVNELPESNCVFQKGNSLFIKEIDKRRKLAKLLVGKKKDVIENDLSRKLNTTVQNHDNHLLVIVKELLHGYTTEMFKTKLYPELATNPDNRTNGNMNNMRRNIETGRALSYDKFLEVLQRMGLDYTLNVIRIKDVDPVDNSPEEEVETLDYNIRSISTELTLMDVMNYIAPVKQNTLKVSTRFEVCENFITNKDF